MSRKEMHIQASKVLAARKQFQPYLDKVNESAVKMPAKIGLTLAEFVEEWRRDVAVTSHAVTPLSTGANPVP